jgi:hypothetical protein
VDELGQQVEYLQAELGGLLEERYQLQVRQCQLVYQLVLCMDQYTASARRIQGPVLM